MYMILNLFYNFAPLDLNECGEIMLLNNIYSIKKCELDENNIILAEIAFNSNSSIYEGHFPFNPITPGVCLINCITDVLSAYTKEAYYLKHADYIKFINLVKPIEFPEVSVSVRIISTIESSILAEGTIFHENHIFLKLKGLFENF